MDTKTLKKTLLNYIKQQKRLKVRIIDGYDGGEYFIENEVGADDFYDWIENKNQTIKVIRISKFSSYPSTLYVVKLDDDYIAVINPYESHAYYVEEYRFNKNLLSKVQTIYTNDFLKFNRKILACVLNKNEGIYGVYKMEFDCDPKMEYDIIKELGFKRCKKEDTSYLKCYVKKSNLKESELKEFETKYLSFKVSNNIKLIKSLSETYVRHIFLFNDDNKQTIQFRIHDHSLELEWFSFDLIRDECKLANMLIVYTNQLIPLLRDILLYKADKIQISNYQNDVNFIKVFNYLNKRVKETQGITEDVFDVTISKTDVIEPYPTTLSPV